MSEAQTEASNVVALPPAPAKITLTAEQGAILDDLEARNTAAGETFRQAYSAHSTAMHALETERKALWDELAVQHNLDKTKAYRVDTVDGQRILSETVAPAEPTHSAPAVVQ